MSNESLRYRAQYETTLARLSSLESRLQPHFLFNTLNSISALIPAIAELEQKLDPSYFVRIHRATLLNLKYVDELTSWFAGGMVVLLKGKTGTKLQVARDRVRELKTRLDL